MSSIATRPVTSLLHAVVAAFVVFTAVWAGPAIAGPYDVKGVAAQADAADAVKAKAKAMAEAQARALDIVLKRITLAQDHARLPLVEKAQVDALVGGLSVDQEQTSSTRYVAKLSFSFDRDGVQQLLRNANVPFSDAQAPIVLVVPVLKNADGVTLAPGNPVAQAWRAFDLTNTLTPVRLPQDNVAEQGISAEGVLAGDPDAMSALRYLHQVEQVLINVCESGQGDQVVCTLKGSGPMGDIDLQERFAGGDVMAAAQGAAGAFLAQLEERWKARSASVLSGNRDGTPVQMLVGFSGLAEWQQIRARLSKVPGVTDIEINALNARGALLTVYYAGASEDLGFALANANMELLQDGPRWQLRVY